MILLVDGEDGSVRDFRITDFDDPLATTTKYRQKQTKNRERTFQYDYSTKKDKKYMHSRLNSHFLSPSNKRNDSNVGGAFIFDTQT